MKSIRKFLMLCLGLTATTVVAQEDMSEWLQNGRPEHIAGDVVAKHPHQVMRKVGSQASAPIKSKGVQKVPVVLVAFADKAFSKGDNVEEVNAYYQKFCNGTMDGKLYTDHGSHGSVRDYFVEQSDSVFFPEFTIIGPVTLDNDCAYYGADSLEVNGKMTYRGRDFNYNQFTKEAIAKAMQVYTQWSDFDNNEDDAIDMVFFIYAGLGQNSGGDTNCLWPKETTSSTTINGTVFSTSGCTCEARPESYTTDSLGNRIITSIKPDGIGVFVHELSHALGLPDFYDTRNVAFGMDLWSVMDYGEYGNNGYNPGNYTAYERNFMGWRELKELKEPCVLTIPCFADGGYGYKIQNDSSSLEYYIIENRQAKGWDDKVCTRGHGLQVTHVDFNQGRWNSNTVNTDANHQRMTIIAANNNYKGTNSAKDAAEWRATLAGNLYPGDTYNYNLTDETTPAAEVYTGGFMRKPLRNITENEDGTVTVCFRTNGKLEVPVPVVTENAEAYRYEIAWDAVENATKYVYELYKGNAVSQSDTLATTSLQVEGMEGSEDLFFRMKALADSPEDYVESDWSELTSLPQLIDHLNTLSSADTMVEVFALNGMHLGRCKANAVRNHFTGRGIYVIRFADGETRKILY